MSNDTDSTESRSPVKGIMFVSAYVDDYEKGYEFYSKTLGLTKLYDMGSQACFFQLGDDAGLYLQGGNPPVRPQVSDSHTSFTLMVDSVSEFFRRLSDADVDMIDDAPVGVGEEHFWFQFRDPAGNIIEAAGGS